jgi:hypothetical protein
LYFVGERKYLLDLGRFFPSIDQQTEYAPSEVFQFRPEFLKAHCKENKLSADAQSNWGEDPKQDEAAQAAKTHLETKVIPEAVEKGMWKQFSPWNISAVLHSEGINVRYLGKVYEGGAVRASLCFFIMIIIWCSL